MKKKILFSILPVFLLIFSEINGSNAQTLNYKKFENMFNQPVTKSSTGDPLTVKETPINMEIISRKEIENSGLTTIFDILDTYSSVDVIRNSATQADVSIRGGNRFVSKSLLVLIDGRRAFNNIFNFTAWNQIPVTLEEIEQIEIIKGPNTALFGKNAVRGAINIITRDPLYNKKSSINAEIGTKHEKVEFSLTNKNDKFGIGLNGQIFNGDRLNDSFSLNFENNLDELKNNPEKKYLNLETKYQIFKNTQIEFGGSISKSKSTSFLPFGNTAFSDGSTKMLFADFSHENSLGRFINNTYFKRTEFDIFNSDQGRIDLNENVFVSNFDYYGLLGKTKYRIGLEYTRSRSTPKVFNVSIDNTGSIIRETDGISDGKIGYDVYSFDFMGRKNWTKNWSTTLSGRFDFIDLKRKNESFVQRNGGRDQKYKTKKGFSFNLTNSFSLTRKDKVKLILSRGIGLPSLLELGSTISTLSVGPPNNRIFRVFFDGSPNAPIEKINHAELMYTKYYKGYEINNSIFIDLVTDVSSFSKIKLNGVNSVTDSDFFNNGSSKTIGYEFRLDKKFKNVKINDNFQFDSKLNFGYTFLKSFDNFKKDNIAFDPSNQTVNNKFSIRSLSEWKNLSLGLSASYKTGFETLKFSILEPTQKEKIGDRFVLNSRLGYKLNTNFSLGLNAQQLNHKKLKRGPGRDTERKIFIDANIRF